MTGNLSLLPALSVYTIRGLHSLGLLLAQAFHWVTPPAQSSPLIALDLNIPTAWVCQHSSLPAPVEEKTAAGISMGLLYATLFGQIASPIIPVACLKSGNPPPFQVSQLVHQYQALSLLLL